MRLPTRDLALDGGACLPVLDLAALGVPEGAPVPVMVDMRSDCGEGNIVEKIRSVVDGGAEVVLWDPEEEWPCFALGRQSGAYFTRGVDLVTRGTFTTIEAALKFGLTARQERIHASL